MSRHTLLSDTNARLAAARRLTSPRHRRETGLFLAEGAPAVHAALARPGTVVEVFVTADALARHRDLLDPIRSDGTRLDEISPAAASALSETVTPQGLVAVCRRIDVPLDAALSRSPSLVAGLVHPADPGNAGAVVRTADAAGASVVVLAGEGVDIYSGKAVRASAGSLFHPDVVLEPDPFALIGAARRAGLRILATTGAGGTDLDELVDDGSLRRPSLWLFGNEAHGLPGPVIAAADVSVRVPIHGGAESLNLAAAAAVCLYASARGQRDPTWRRAADDRAP